MDASPLVAEATHRASETLASDPVVQGLLWVMAILFLAMAAVKPVRDWLRSMLNESRDDRVGEAKASAESTLYNHLSQQVEQYRKIADEAYKERNILVARVSALEVKTDILDETKATLDRLKHKLEEKDTKIEEKDKEIRRLLDQAAEERRQFLAILQSKDAEITKRDERITSLEERQRELESRLMRDEVSLGVIQCPFSTGSVVPGVGVIPVPEAAGN